MQGHYQGFVRHPVSLVGVALASFSLVNIILLFLLEVLGGRANPYLGILAYMVFPAILILGLLIIPVGMLLERR